MCSKTDIMTMVLIDRIKLSSLGSQCCILIVSWWKKISVFDFHIGSYMQNQIGLRQEMKDLRSMKGRSRQPRGFGCTIFPAAIYRAVSYSINYRASGMIYQISSWHTDIWKRIVLRVWTFRSLDYWKSEHLNQDVCHV